MTVVDSTRASEAETGVANVMLVSGDSHVGPSLDLLRDHCPKQHRDDFDAFAGSESVATMRAMFGTNPDALNLRTAGHHDVAARLDDMDTDGIAAEIIFHNSFNGEPMPFADSGWPDPANPELARIGFQIYNRWLAEFCEAAPERLIGLAHIPIWDLDAAVEETRWAADHGFRGINFPATRPGWAHYNDPVWEPLWDVAEAAGLVLTTHAGGGADPASMAEFATPLMLIETGGVLNRRPIPRMVIGGVFERHPGLKLAMTEQPGVWVPAMLAEMDSAVLGMPPVRWTPLPKSPSEYFTSNVFVGASFIAPFEVRDAIEHGYWTNLFWGRDYPHPEGTWRFRESLDEVPMTHLSLRHAFAGAPEAELRAVVGTNAVSIYGLDGDALRVIADKIGPSLSQITTPLETVPASDGPERQGMGMFSFRTIGGWA
jgi:predicted TIM-barrel fold metal-dependent hydrolase